MSGGDGGDPVEDKLLGGLLDIGQRLGSLLSIYDKKIIPMIQESIIYNTPANAFDELKDAPIKNWFLLALIKCGKLNEEAARDIEIHLKTQQFKELGISPYVFARQAKMWADRIAGEFERAYDAMVFLSDDIKIKAPEILETFNLAISNFLSEAVDS